MAQDMDIITVYVPGNQHTLHHLIVATALNAQDHVANFPMEIFRAKLASFPSMISRRFHSLFSVLEFN